MTKKIKTKKIVIGLSGGLDSTSLLGLLLGRGYEVHCCSFTYGSKHNKYENAAVLNIIKYYEDRGYPVILHTFNLTEAFKDFQSNLLKTGGPIPEGNYNDKTMALTIVPGRNMIFAAIMAGLAESIEAEAIGLGVHAGDHEIYPDCRPEFVKALNKTIQFSTNKKVEVLTPFLYDDKAFILHEGYHGEVKIPYELTRTCYKDQQDSCGKCGSCNERLLAFKKLGIEDPIKYEE